jgi:TRAP-type C4-dicarboxylate transport system permease small subunit
MRIMMQIIRSFINFASNLGRRLDHVAGLATVAMMVLICSDVVLRLVYRPMPGTYELVGMLGAIAASFALAHASTRDAHVAVTLFVERLPKRVKGLTASTINAIGALFFALLAWQSWAYGNELRVDKEVSLVLLWPICPVVYGMSIGCTALSLVLIGRFLDGIIKEGKS